MICALRWPAFCKPRLREPISAVLAPLNARSCGKAQTAPEEYLADSQDCWCRHREWPFWTEGTPCDTFHSESIPVTGWPRHPDGLARGAGLYGAELHSSDLLSCDETFLLDQTFTRIGQDTGWCQIMYNSNSKPTSLHFFAGTLAACTFHDVGVRGPGLLVLLGLGSSGGQEDKEFSLHPGEIGSVGSPVKMSDRAWVLFLDFRRVFTISPLVLVTRYIYSHTCT